MRTNIDIDDKLMKQAMKATRTTTKKATVEAALRLAVEMQRQQKALKALWGMGWEGDLDEMRLNRHADWDRTWETKANSGQKSVA